MTEILYALGLENRVIAVDTTSHYPARARADKPSVGYMRQLSAEGVLGLAPSLVLAADGSGPKETISVLEAARVPFVRVPDRFTGEGIIEKIRLIAQATGAVERGECLAKTVATDLGALATLRKHIERPLKVLFVLSFTNGRPMVAGRATAADGIITLAGAVNAITEYEGYKLVNDESVLAARPDAVLVPPCVSTPGWCSSIRPSRPRPPPRAARSSRWRVFISSASDRARRTRPATSRSRSIPRSAASQHGPKP